MKRLIVGAIVATVVGLVGAPVAQAEGACWYETSPSIVATIDRSFILGEHVENVASLGFVRTDYIGGDIVAGNITVATATCMRGAAS